MRDFFNKHFADYKMQHFGELHALHPTNILKVFNDGVGTLGKDMIVALCRRVALIEEKNRLLIEQLNEEQPND